MWFLLLYLVTAAQGENQIALRGSKSPCKGRLEVYNDGQWGLVCYHSWNSIYNQDQKNGEVVCASLECGAHLQSGHNKDTYRDPALPTRFWMDEVKCKGGEKNLWDCKKPGVTQCQADNYVTVECSGSIELRLNKNGRTDECAGVVQFKTHNKIVGVCNKQWDETKANMVCEELQCGKHYKIPEAGTFGRGNSTSNVSLSCRGNNKFTWQCAQPNTCQEEANVICSNYQSIRLKSDDGNVCRGKLQEKTESKRTDWVPVPYKKVRKTADDLCSKLNCGKYGNLTQCDGSNDTCLTCTDEVKVELQQRCSGEVFVKLNGKRQTVCYDGLSKDKLQRLGDVVCKELNCGKLLIFSEGPVRTNGLLSKVDCSGNEASLWDCLAKYEGNQQCKSINVTCAAFETVTLQGGLGRCSGRLQVTFEGLQWSVSAPQWSQINSDVVCKQLGCGKSQKALQGNLFVGSNLNHLKWNLNCKEGLDNLSQCIWTERKAPDPKVPRQEDVDIFCENEKLWYLRGDAPCRGEVKVESDGRSWFVNETEMDQDVCQWLHCGNDVRPANSTSQASSTNSTIPQFNSTRVHVNCSGSVTVTLENSNNEKCWGKVKVCMDGNCGEVCGDTWMKSHSSMLCENLGCGQAVTEYGESLDSRLTVGSVHCSKETQNLSQCFFAPMSKHSTCQSPVYVSCTGSVRAKLNDPRDKCAGRVELFHLGKWNPVCLNGIVSETQTTICKSLGCGEVVNFTKSNYGASGAQGLSGINCGSNMSTCDFINAKTQKCDIGHLTCTGWRRLLLTDPHNACSGKVYARDKNGLIAVSREGWQKSQGDKLCEYLSCGKFNNFIEENNEQRNRSYKCTGTPKSLLDCDIQEKPAQLQHLNIKCDGKPEVKLSLKENCTGVVRINQNELMCGNSQNTERVLGELCHHRHCGKFITSWSTPVKGEGRSFSCTGHENMLWQCNSWKESCDSVVSVTCAGGVKFNFTENCGGHLQVQYRGRWEHVCINDPEDAHVICRNMGCGNAKNTGNSYLYEGSRMSFKCENKHASDPAECIKDEFCEGDNIKDTIKCEKYVPVVEVVPPSAALIAGLVIGLLFLLVAIVIVIWQRKRFLAILRLKPSPEDEDVELSSKEMQDLNEKNRDLSDRKSSVFEIDDYEDIDPVLNPMENKSKKQELQPPEGEDENSSTSGDSSRTEYDDVEENSGRLQEPGDSNPTEPLLPPRPANLLDDYEVQLEEVEDYDDAMPAHTVVSETEENSDASVAADMSVEPDD